MDLQGLLLRFLGAAVLAALLLALFGGLRPSAAAFSLTTAVVCGLARDLAGSRPSLQDR